MRHPSAAAPARSAPAQSNPSWTGAQVGGQGGVSPMAQGFAEPGAYLFPRPVLFAGPLLRDAIQLHR